MTPIELQLMREMQNMRFAAVIFRFLAQTTLVNDGESVPTLNNRNYKNGGKK